MVRPALGHVLVLCLVPAALAAGCGSRVDLKQALKITDISGGWYDAGIVNGKNKLVPSVTFRIEKPADVTVRPLWNVSA